MNKEIRLHSAVVSTSGRDKGTCYLVVEVQDKYVFVSDGKKHSLKHPKRKNAKHIKLVADEVESLSAEINGRGLSGITDCFLHKSLRTYK